MRSKSVQIETNLSSPKGPIKIIVTEPCGLVQAELLLTLLAISVPAMTHTLLACRPGGGDDLVRRGGRYQGLRTGALEGIVDGVGAGGGAMAPPSARLLCSNSASGEGVSMWMTPMAGISGVPATPEASWTIAISLYASNSR